MGLVIKQNIPLAEYTTLKVGGVADYFADVKSVMELVEALRFTSQTATPPLIIGGGSNLLVSDVGYRGLVIKNSIFGLEYLAQGNDILLSCGAGEILDNAVEDSVSKGYWGLENLSAIPGTVGATPIQNVGAYGVEVSSLVKEVVAMHMKTYEEKIFRVADCQFGYRDSFFKTPVGRQWVVVKVVFQLTKNSNPKIEYGDLKKMAGTPNLKPATVREEVVKIRATKFPDWHQVGTAGSFFKNPIISSRQCQELLIKYPDLPTYTMLGDKKKISLGWLLDSVCGLRGYCHNGVCLYDKQALVLVNTRASSAADIESFANKVAEIVEEKTGVKIEREVRGV